MKFKFKLKIRSEEEIQWKLSICHNNKYNHNYNKQLN